MVMEHNFSVNLRLYTSLKKDPKSRPSAAELLVYFAYIIIFSNLNFHRNTILSKIMKICH